MKCYLVTFEISYQKKDKRSIYVVSDSHEMAVSMATEAAIRRGLSDPVFCGIEELCVLDFLPLLKNTNDRFCGFLKTLLN